MREYLFECKYCAQKFKLEVRFLKHNCKMMQRNQDFKSLQGQLAYRFYKLWMKKKYNNTIVNSNSFTTSKYFQSFFKLAYHVRYYNIVLPERFIDFMIKEKIEPKYWCLNDAQANYLQYLARTLTPIEATEISIKTLYDISDKQHIKVSTIPDILTVSEIIDLLYKKMLSPWFILNSQKFIKKLKQCNEDENKTLVKLINPTFWKNRFDKHIEEIEKIKRYVKEMGI